MTWAVQSDTRFNDLLSVVFADENRVNLYDGFQSDFHDLRKDDMF